MKLGRFTTATAATWRTEANNSKVSQELNIITIANQNHKEYPSLYY